MKLDTIGKNIRKFRLAKKLRQEDLAERTSLTANYIGMVERGEKIPSLETFIKILNALGVSGDMVLVDVLDTGYTVKNSMLNEKLEKLATKDWNRIYEVIDTLVKQSKQISPSSNAEVCSGKGVIEKDDIQHIKYLIWTWQKGALVAPFCCVQLFCNTFISKKESPKSKYDRKSILRVKTE